MAYNPDIPQGGDKPSDSQAEILANFQALNTVFAEDHLAFNAVNGGRHVQVTFPTVLGAIPTPPAPANAYPVGSVFTNSVLIGAVTFSELFYESTRDVGANIVRQLTGIEVVNPGAGGVNDYGITTPWGLIINWGTYNPAGTGQALTFAVTFTAGTVPVVQVSREEAAAPSTQTVSYQAGVTNAGFTVLGSDAPFAGSYIAIGV